MKGNEERKARGGKEGKKGEGKEERGGSDLVKCEAVGGVKEGI